MHTVDVALGNRSYPVMIGKGLLDQPELWEPYLGNEKVLVVSNEIVAPLYLKQLNKSLQDCSRRSLVLEDGEQSKTVANWSVIIDELIDMKAGRDVCLIALGGGVIGDLCGFAAATYMRGVPFIQIPTTLLAQVDASVGGKTAVNHVQGKNLVGAFHQPRMVLIDTDTLNTLPDREFRAGLAEVVKYGVIRDGGFFDWIESHADEILNRDPAVLRQLIETSVRNKAAVVSEDERECGVRALLNFGHTFGHALETVTEYTRFLHGEAVGIGMLVAARLSETGGYCKAGTTSRISGLLEKLGLPASLPADLNIDNIVEVMAMDKKVLGGQHRLVLLNALGAAFIETGCPEQAIQNALLESR